MDSLFAVYADYCDKNFQARFPDGEVLESIERRECTIVSVAFYSESTHYCQCSNVFPRQLCRFSHGGGCYTGLMGFWIGELSIHKRW